MSLLFFQRLSLGATYTSPCILRLTALHNRNAVIKDECIGATMHSQIDAPDRSLSLSTPTLQVDPSTFYPTPPRSVSPLSAIGLAHSSVSARQPTAVAGSSTWSSYSEASNVPSPLARNPYRALLFKDVETPTTWGSSSKKNRQCVASVIPSSVS